ncbi:MAG: MFS transporter [Gemmatimonadales bacterium]|nr:MFS transporter [Gemmatimonadales bacterium]
MIELSKAKRAWCMYDWANSAFATTVMAALFPPFFRNIAQSAGFGETASTSLWGYVTAGALLLLALTAPVLGALSDAQSRRKVFLGFFAGLGILATTLFVVLGDDDWKLAALLFGAANFGFGSSIIFYESLLPGLAQGREMDRLSTQAYGWGYAGGGLLLVVNLLMVTKPALFGLAGMGQAVKLSFLTVALWWGVFSVPLFRHVPEPSGQAGGSREKPGLGDGFRRLAATFRAIGRHRNLTLFLVAYWIYNDGIGTIVKMATAYGSEIGIGMTDLMGALVLTQVVGIPCALLFGRLAARIGAKKAIVFALSIYCLISVGGFFLQSAAHFYVLAGLVGTVQGGAQALSRSVFGSMVPRHRSAEFFGFYSTSGKLAGVAGPLVFGLVGQVTGTSRLGIMALVVFFVLGGWLLSRVDVRAGQLEARRIEAEERVT